MVDGGGLAEGPVGGAGLGCVGPHVGGEASGEGAVGALGVVDDAEQVELGLELGEGGGAGLFGEPPLDGLVEAFGFPVALRVVGAGV